MIANRFRLERQISVGRRAVRRSLSSKDKSRTPYPDGKTRLGGLAETVNSASQPLNHTSSNDGESPFPADTDAEAAFAANRPRLPSIHTQAFTSSNHSGPSIPYDKEGNSPDPLRSPIARRKWASNLLKGDDSSSGFFPTTMADPPSDEESISPKQAVQSSSTPSNFFRRLRTRSFPSLSSPFSSLRLPKRTVGPQASKDTATEQGWSSDSSSDDDDLLVDEQRHIHHPPYRDLQNHISGDEYSGEEEQDDDDYDVY